MPALHVASFKIPPSRASRGRPFICAEATMVAPQDIDKALNAVSYSAYNRIITFICLRGHEAWSLQCFLASILSTCTATSTFFMATASLTVFSYYLFYLGSFSLSVKFPFNLWHFWFPLSCSWLTHIANFQHPLVHLAEFYPSNNSSWSFTELFKF